MNTHVRSSIVCVILLLALLMHWTVTAQAKSYVPETPNIELLEPYQSTMPGGYGIPFGFAITKKTTLSFATDNAAFLPIDTDQDTEYYVADPKIAKAIFMGMSCMAEGDTVGIARTNGRLYWVVDNSRFNKRDAFWVRPFSAEEYRLVRINERGSMKF